MTEPSLHSTFDTSLIDLSPKVSQQENATAQGNDTNVASTLQDSFSTTDTAPSDDYKQAINSLLTPQPLAPDTTQFAQVSTTKTKIPVRYVPTVDAYDAWAGVYDSDGNVLQSIDDYELSSMLPEFISATSRTLDPEREISIVDLGCGTGRNSVKVLCSQSWQDARVRVVGIDASKGMLTLAEEKMELASASLSKHLKGKRRYEILRHDFLDPKDALAPPVLLSGQPKFDALVTTLVLEHFPLGTFFAVLSSLLEPNGMALLTNMHPEMGSQSQAGFVSSGPDGKAVKVRGTSWGHGVQETVDAAKAAGFVVVGDVRERGIDEGLIEKGIVGGRGRKWIGVKIWYGMIFKKVG